MDESTFVLILGVIAVVLGAVEVIRTRWQSLPGWGLIVAGLGLVVLGLPS